MYNQAMNEDKPRYLRAKEIQKKYGVSPAHCNRDLAGKGCRTKEYIFCGRTCTSYYEPDVKRIVGELRKRQAVRKEHYSARPDVMRGTKSRLKKVLPNKMYTKLRNAWFGMMRRCYTDDRPDYHHYREFGIGICDEWLNNFDSFALWSLNNGVEHGLTLDRIDNNKGYCPENCRWVSKKIQNNNTSVNTTIRYKGKEYTIAELSEAFEIPYDRLWCRLMHLGWGVEESITRPAGWKRGKKELLVTYKGETKPLFVWAAELGIAYSRVLGRYQRGLPPEKIFAKGRFTSSGKFIPEP